MTQAVLKEEMPAGRKLCWGSLGAGSLGLATGLAAVAVEISRNYEFGAAKGPIVGATYALFAVGLAVVPAIAQKAGWNAMLRTLFAVCMAMTAYFGVAYYSAGILAKADAAKTRMAAYRDARAEIAAAQKARDDAEAEATAIAETASVEDLLAIVARERELAQIEAKDRGGRGKLAKAHEDAEQAAMTRVPAARAKAAALARADAASARLAKARDDAKGGTVTTAPLATLIAEQTGGNAELIASAIDLGEPLFMVLGMLFFAALIDKSLSTLICGLGRREVVAELPAAPAAKLAQKAKAKPQAPLSDCELIALFIGQLRMGQGELTPKELYSHFCVFWMARASERALPSHRTLASSLTAKGVARNRRGGQTRYEVALAA
jgi:hypothetical protein